MMRRIWICALTIADSKFFRDNDPNLLVVFAIDGIELGFDCKEKKQKEEEEAGVATAQGKRKNVSLSLSCLIRVGLVEGDRDW